MAVKKTPSEATSPNTSIPSNTGDPNQPDINFGTTAQDTGEDTASSGFSQFAQQKFDEAWTILRQQPLKKRLATLNNLYQRGFGSNSEVSVDGLSATDVARYRDLLIYAEISNKTVDQVVAKDFKENFPVVRTVGGTSKKTPQQDVDRIFSDVMRVQLGRGPKQDELERFRNAYSGMESGDNAPSLQSAAEQQIQTVNSQEARTQRFAGYMDTFQQMLRGA